MSLLLSHKGETEVGFVGVAGSEEALNGERCSMAGPRAADSMKWFLSGIGRLHRK